MIKPSYADAIYALVGGRLGGPSNGPISKFVFDDGQTPPSEEAIQAKLAELQADYDSKSYARNRQQNFPNEHDLLIALWEKVMEDRSESADALQVIRTQVKSDNPKPQ